MSAEFQCINTSKDGGTQDDVKQMGYLMTLKTNDPAAKF